MYGYFFAGAICIYIAFCMLWGFARGVSRSKFRFGTVVLSAGISLIVMIAIRAMMSEEKMVSWGQFVVDIFNAPVVSEFMTSSPELAVLFGKLAYSMLSPLLIFLIFIGVSIVTWIAFFIITILFRPIIKNSDRTKKLRKLRGAFYGALQGVVVVIMFLIPVSSYLELAPIALNAATIEDTPLPENVVSGLEIAKEVIEPTNNGVVITSFRNYGGGHLCEFYTNMLVDNYQVKLSDEISSITDFGVNAFALTGKEVKDFGSEEVQALKNVASSFEDSKILTVITCEGVKGFTDRWKQGESFIGIEKPDMGDLLNPLVDQMIVILNTSSSNPEYMAEDVHTLVSVMEILIVNDVLSAMTDSEEAGFSQVITQMASDGVVTELVTTLGENERMSTLIPLIKDMGLKAIASYLGIPENLDEIYTTLLSDIAASLQTNKGLPIDEMLSNLTSDLIDALGVAGMEIHPDIIDLIATGMTGDFAGFEGEITPEFISEFFRINGLDLSEGEEDDSENGGVSFDGSVYFEKIPLIIKTTDDTSGSQYTFPGYVSGNVSDTGASAAGQVIRQITSILQNDDISDKSAAINAAVNEVYGDIIENLVSKIDDEQEKTAFRQSISENLSRISASIASSETEKVISSLSSANSLSSSTIQTTLITMDALLTSSSSEGTVTAQDAKSIEGIVAGAAKILNGINNMDGGLSATEIFEGLGGILDSMSASDTFGQDLTSNLFKAVVQSKTVSEKTGMSVSELGTIADSVINNDNVSYGDITKTVSSLVKVLEKLGDASTINEQDLTDFMKSITPGTSKIISDMINVDFVKKYSPNMSNDTASTVSVFFKDLFKNISETDSTEFEQDSRAMKRLLEIAVSKTIPVDLNEFIDDTISSGSIMDSLATITVADSVVSVYDPFGVFEDVDKEGESMTSVKNAALNYYNSNVDEDTPEVEKQALQFKINIVMAVFGLTLNYDQNPGA